MQNPLKAASCLALRGSLSRIAVSNGSSQLVSSTSKKCPTNAETRPLTPNASLLTHHFGMSFALESASAAGLSGVGAGGCVASGTVAGVEVAGWVAMTPLPSVLCDEYHVS